MNQNVTLKLDKELILKAKILATKNRTSLSRLMVTALKKYVGTPEEYQKARRKALSLLKKGVNLGGGPYYSDRSQLHER